MRYCVWQIATQEVITMESVLEKKKATNSRLNIRLSPDIKARISRAAHILGQDLTEFTASTLGRYADEIIDNHEQILLSERDYKFFIAELEKPATAPSEYSKKAMDDYRRVFKGNQI